MRMTLSTRALTATLILVLVGAARPQSETPSTPSAQHSMGSRKHYVGLPNFGEVTPNLFRGGQPGTDGLETLRKMGVSIDIDMRSTKSSHEESVASKLGIEYVSIPWHCPFPSDPVFVRFLKVIEQNRGKKIFVHCRLGDDRTGMAIASYRMAEEGWSTDEALNEMRVFGFNTAHHAICPTLAAYAKHFPDHLKSNPAFKELQLPQLTKQ